MSSFHYQSPIFDRVHDVVIFGAGYAGFAAARALVAAGRQVLLVDRRAALLAESGWSFESEVGDAALPEWRRWLGELEDRDALRGGLVDGALAEVIATQCVQAMRGQGTLAVLYYATPMAVQGTEDAAGSLLESVLMGVKGAMRHLVARQWIDATDDGELVNLLAAAQGREWRPPVPVERRLHLYFRHLDWQKLPEEPLTGAVPGLSLGWRRTRWAGERVLTATITGQASGSAREKWVPILRAAREWVPRPTTDALLTHGGIEPYGVFECASAPIRLPANVVAANPWTVPNSAGRGLAGRFLHGAHAATQLLDAPSARPRLDAPFEGVIRWREKSSSVAVAGLGTGGALAALAAARQGARTLGFDPLPFAGGIGAGGGIHLYYFGMKGGLQEEIDAEMRRVGPLFASRGQIQGFHPEAKKCVLEGLLTAGGVQLMHGATLTGTERAGGRVTSAHLATPGGPVRLSAASWIDATGDGDLASSAGARSSFGRQGDGLLHAYSQSSGTVELRQGKLYQRLVNYDAGFLDPTDAEDLTRGRLAGISHYAQAKYTEVEHPHYIAPAIGIRQSRQIETDYVLQLHDQIEGTYFPDAVGVTGCHSDNHAQDCQFESDEALFWVWVCRAFGEPVGCQIPYRILLPVGLDNVWLACRALGVSQDAHYSLRMQRDMQRVGEVAGIAAALAGGGPSREVDFELLRATLRASGALAPAGLEDDPFGPTTDVAGPASEEVESWLRALGTGTPLTALWHLYRAGLGSARLRDSVKARLANPDPDVAWRAASLGAMWSEPWSETPLLGNLADWKGAPEVGHDYAREVPRWVIALGVLRRVATPAALTALGILASRIELDHRVRTSLALCCEGICRRHSLTVQERSGMIGILNRVIDGVKRDEFRELHRHWQSPPGSPAARPVVRDLTAWQLHLTVARARRMLGLPLHEEAQTFLHDERALIRRAFSQFSCG